MHHFKTYSAFYIPYVLFVLTFGMLILTHEKADLHLLLSSFHTPTRDLFFKYFTEVGGSFPYFVIVGLMFYRYRLALFLLITQFASGLVSQMIKQSWDAPRPLKYFAINYPDLKLHAVAGVELHSSHSFPSGHTITAFAFFLSLALFSKRPLVHFLCFVAALLVGYSRIYLSQHFALDVLVGSIVALAVTISWKFYYDELSLPWANGSLRTLFLRKK
jgi:membrane-associated phospholipid phosphatase